MKKDKPLKAIILAGGLSSRMKSKTPKPLIDLWGQPIINYVIQILKKCNVEEIAVVTNPSKEGQQVKSYVESKGCKVFVQEESLGTAHAVLAAKDFLKDKESNFLILCADTPLIKSEDLMSLQKNKTIYSTSWSGSFLSMRIPANSHSFGILKTTNKEEILSIVEASERTKKNEETKTFDLCNSGICLLSGKHALKILEKISNNNAKREYFLTDYPLVCQDFSLICNSVVSTDRDSCLGINTPLEFSKAAETLQNKWRKKFMKEGVRLLAPETIFFSYDTQIEPDTIIEPNVIFGPKTYIEQSSIIRAFSHIEGAHIKSKACIGPYARIRPETTIGENAKVGNFVEIKKSHLKSEVKVSHLSYIGDTVIDSKANIGAGTITCNYDGKNKHKTHIGKEAFIGSNCALVAPVSIGEKATVGAGSTITKNVAPESLSLTRTPQKSIKKFKKRTPK